MNLERRLILKFLTVTLLSCAYLNKADVIFGREPEDELPASKEMASFYFHGNPHEPYVSLTIDDCWNIENAKKILEIAQQAQVKLTFFPGGNLFLNYPSFWQEVLLAGHEIENHTVNHFPLTKLNETQILDQIDKTQQYYQWALSKYRPDGEIPPMRFIRPPWGQGFLPTMDEDERIKQEKRIRQVVFKRNLGLALWSNNITQIETIGPGAIILLHTNDEDLVALKRAIKIAKDKRLEAVTVNELLNPQIRRQSQIKFERSGEL